MSEEIWKPIPGYYGYEASNLRRIKRLARSVAGISNHGKPCIKNFPERICTESRFGDVFVENDEIGNSRIASWRLVNLAFGVKEHEDLEGEIWKVIPGWDGYYECSTHGRFRSLDRVVVFIEKGREKKRRCWGQMLEKWKAGSDRQRNFIALACGQGDGELEKHPCARLVWLTHRGPLLEGCEVHHRNRIWGDDSVDNLEQITVAECRATRILPQGEERWNAVATEKDVKFIRSSGLSRDEKSEKLSLNKSIIGNIERGATWKHVK